MCVAHFNHHGGFLVRQDVHIGRSPAEAVDAEFLLEAVSDLEHGDAVRLRVFDAEGQHLGEDLVADQAAESIVNVRHRVLEAQNAVVVLVSGKEFQGES